MNLNTARTGVELQLFLVKVKHFTTKPYRTIFRTFVACVLLSSSTLLIADELLLEAITDFPNMNAGEIPYYIDLSLIHI